MFIVAIFLNKLQINEKKLVLVIILNSLKQTRSPSAKPFLEREPHHNTNCKANSADLCTCCQRNNPAAMQNKLTLGEKNSTFDVRLTYKQHCIVGFIRLATFSHQHKQEVVYLVMSHINRNNYDFLCPGDSSDISIWAT